MNREQTPKSPAAKTGLFAVLSNLLRGQGSSAPSTSLGTPSPQITKAEQAHLPAGVGPRRRASLGFASVLAIAALISLGAAPALAAPPTQFGSEGPGAGQLSSEPSAVAVEQSSGDLYVADRNNNRIVKFGPEGEFKLTFGWGVADGAAEPQTCGPESIPLSINCRAGLEGAGAGEFAFPEGIAIDNDPLSASHGDLYIADVRNHRVQKFSPSGQFLLAFGGKVNATTEANICLAGEACREGSEGPAPGEFEALGHHPIAVDGTGTVYVGSSERIQKFSPGGVYESELTFSGVGFVENLAVDPAGDVYFKGSEQTGIHKYDLAGVELDTPRDAAGAPSAIAIGSGEQLLIGDESEGQHLFAYDASGTQLSSFDGGGVEGGQRGIAYGEGIEAVYVLNQGRVRIVSVPPPGPLVVKQSTGEIEPTSALLEATLNPENAETEYFFEYGPADCESSSCLTTTAATLEDSGAPLVDFKDHPLSVAISALAPRTVYHYRLVAENADGTVRGPEQTFTTLPPVSIETLSAKGVSATSATLEATLDPHGLASEYRFDYGTTTNYGSTTPIPDGSLGAAKGPVTRTALLQGLEPGVTYHYRVIAQNSLGTVESEDHEFTTQGPSDSVLPDGRQWELVSPPDKHGAILEPITEEGGVIQAAASGDALTYLTKSSIEPGPLGNLPPAYNQALASHTPSGWRNLDITTRHDSTTDLNPGQLAEYKQFSQDLTHALVNPLGALPLSILTTERTPYLWDPTGTFVPLVTEANVPPGTKFGGTENPETPGTFSEEVGVMAGTPDLSTVILTSDQALTRPVFESHDRPSLYAWNEGSLRLVSVLPDGEPAAAVGAPASLGHNGQIMRNAVSDDGNRIIFEASALGTAHLYLRDIARKETVELDLAERGATGEGSGDPVFQGASEDGSKVFFTDSHRLTTNSTALGGEPDLYMCDVVLEANHLHCDLSDLSVTSVPGEAADVRGVVSAIDAAGTHIYFAANGVLTRDPSSRGEVAAGAECQSTGATAKCNLYEYDTTNSTVSLVAVLSSQDNSDWAERAQRQSLLGMLTGRVSPNGQYFAFMSQRSLTGYDNRDASSGAPDQEVYLYDGMSGALRCVSCNPTAARPHGVFDQPAFPGPLVDHPRADGDRWLAGSLPAWTARDGLTALYQSRYLSDTGRLFFNANDALTPQDSNGTEDVYEYEAPNGPGQTPSDSCTTTSPAYSPAAGGCISLISSGTSPEESAFLDASESGNDVFFLTASRLSTEDVDGAADIYDAHVCSSEEPCPSPPSPPPPSCEGDACQQPAVPPGDATPGSLTFNGVGNLVACPKGKIKRHGKCAKKKHKHRKSNKHRKSKATKRVMSTQVGAE